MRRGLRGEIQNESPFLPIIASPDSVYHGFHVERYTHAAPRVDMSSVLGTSAIVALGAFRYAVRQRTHLQWHTNQHGMVNLLPREHTGLWEFETSVDCVHLRFDNLYLQNIAERNDVGSVELVETLGASDPQIRHIALSLLSEVEAGCPGGRLFGESLMIGLAAHLFTRYAAFPTSPKEVKSNRLSAQQLRRVTDYLQDNLSGDVSLHTLAGIVSVSPYHFARLFKESTGMAPHQFVIQERINRAKQAILHGEKSIAQIAREVGFADASHLNRHMKRQLGASPKTFWRSGT